MIELAVSGNPVTRELLTTHPRVHRVEVGPNHGIQFSQGVWQREVFIGDVSRDLYGLLEVVDNNPLVCADQMSVPGAATTLALIALSPLAQAGIIDDSPVVVVNVDADESELEAAIFRAGWHSGIALHCEPVDLGGVVAATVMVAVRSSASIDEIDELFAEQFERSFYVHRDEDSVWDPGLVAGKPYALYRFSIAPDSPSSLLTVRLLADSNGKCGSAQAIHAMNVMCGFEESIGIFGGGV